MSCARGLPRIVLIALTFALLGASACSSSGTPTGGNGGNGGNGGGPIQDAHALALAVSRMAPGDTLEVPLGTYVINDFEDILRPPSGTEAEPVIIRGAAGRQGQRPVIAGRDNLLALIILAGVSYVQVENLELTHDPAATGQAAWCRDGVQIMDGLSRGIVLDNLYIHHLDEFGLNAMDVDGLEVTGCHIEHCGYGAVGGPDGEHGGWQNVVIRNTGLSYSGHYWQGGDGTNRPYDRPDGLGTEESAGPLLIEDVVCEHNFGDGLDSKCHNTTIRRCVVANNSCDGVKLWGAGSTVENSLIYGRGDGDAEPTAWSAVVIHSETAGAPFALVNCTIDDAMGGNYLMHVNYDAPTVGIALTLRNTIFSSRGASAPIWLNGATVLTAEHNLFWMPVLDRLIEHGATEWTAANIGGLGTGNGVGDPGFVEAAWGSDGDYHVAAASPAVGHGMAAGAPNHDLANAARPAGGGCDIGAYEQ